MFLLGGSWVVISGVISRVTMVITHIRGLITLLITTHEPPSGAGLGDFGVRGSEFSMWAVLYTRVPLGSFYIRVPYSIGDPQRDRNLENYPYIPIYIYIYIYEGVDKVACGCAGVAPLIEGFGLKSAVCSVFCGVVVMHGGVLDSVRKLNDNPLYYRLSQ